ncbi:hypothetical protein JXO59_13290, partial [candidate division KSB1 bacterium]|nr:hypothetical protein [candidate division KSB1 bacterium]
MKSVSFFVIIMIFPFTLRAQQTVADWENPAVFDINREKPHATFVPYPDGASTLEDNKKSSPLYQNLNGIWKFYWIEKPA